MNYKTALLFPGQGSHCHQMFDKIKSDSLFIELHDTVSSVLNENLVDRFKSKDQTFINSNIISSISTILCSVYSLTKLKEKNINFDLVSGYSVGQYTALFAADMINFETLCNLIKERCELMDDVMKVYDAGMLAVIGLEQKNIEDICLKLRCKNNEQLWISNYNAPGQFTIAGIKKSLIVAEKELKKLNALKLIHIPVSGAWHCPLLNTAAAKFNIILKSYPFKTTNCKVVDNVTGLYLPENKANLIDTLCKHLKSPVLWHKSIEFLINEGANLYYEVGYGNTLSKYGFFINRKVKFKPTLI